MKVQNGERQKNLHYRKTPYTEQSDPAYLQTSKFPVPPLMLHFKPATVLPVFIWGSFSCSEELADNMWHPVKTTGSFIFFMYPFQYINLNTASVSPLPTYSPSCRPVSFHFPNHSCKLFTHRDIALVTFVRPLRGPALFSQLNTSIQKIFLWT